DRERDVDRGGDLAVGDGEQRRRAEHALEGWELPRHARSLTRTLEVEPAHSERDEQDAEHVPDAAAGACRLDEQPDPDAHEQTAEDDDGVAVGLPHAAARRPAPTITRQSACLST